MISKLSDIKVVFEDFFDFYREREKKLKNEKLLNGKTLQINLKRNDN